MAKAKTYITDINAMVKADHGNKIPKHLKLTIRNYAKALEMRDAIQEKIMENPAGVLWTEYGSMGQQITKQHPLLPTLYQWETLIQKYAKDLGGTAAKAAAKPESADSDKANNTLDAFIEGING